MSHDVRSVSWSATTRHAERQGRAAQPPADAAFAALADWEANTPPSMCGSFGAFAAQILGTGVAVRRRCAPGPLSAGSLAAVSYVA
jgi:hypothetical protein